MTISRSPSLANGAAVAGHGLALAGFLLPWVVGEFGVRQRLTGLDLARLAGETVMEGLAGEILALPITGFVLLLVPLAAANALALLAANQAGVLSQPAVHRSAVLLAVPVVTVPLVGLALVLVSVGDGVLSAPGFGLVTAIAGGALSISSGHLAKPETGH